MAKVPFSDEIRQLVLDKLKDQEFVQSLITELRRLFKVATTHNVPLTVCMMSVCAPIITD